MKVDFLQHNITKLISQRNGCMGISMGLLLSNIILGITVFSKSERTLFVPPQIKRPFWVQGKEFSKEYLEEMGVYLSKLLLDLTPSTFSYNHETLLQYATPESYGSLKSQLLKDGQHYTSLQLSTHFYAAQVIANPQTYEVEVKGTLTNYVSGKQINSSQETVLLKFTERGGGLLLERVTGGISHES